MEDITNNEKFWKKLSGLIGINEITKRKIKEA